MRNYRTSQPIIFLILVVLFSGSAFGYKEMTHAEISKKAAQQSVLHDPETLKNIGLRALPINSDDQQFKNDVVPNGLVKSETTNILKLIADGAIFEDAFPRSLHHFFDLNNDHGPIRNCGSLISPFDPSPDWALEDSSDPNIFQKFSYTDAKQYLYDAITSQVGSSPAEKENNRKKNWGRLFQTLGMVMHHIQDMAQPQHVRNDAHLDVQSLTVTGCYNPSVYEEYSYEVSRSAALPLSPQNDTPFPEVVDISSFPTPRSFWKSNGKGIAEFTNSNFLSADTNFDSHRYELPTPEPTGEVADIHDLCANPAIPCPNPNFSGYMTFLGSYVRDIYLGNGAPIYNPRASTHSIFSADLKQAGKTEIYTLNRFNFDQAHRFLIPRAVAYSAGLVNYFFRGKLEISLPDEGIYGVVDHTTLEGSDPVTGGFRKIKLKLKNATLGGKDAQGVDFKNDIDTGTNASLVAVVKFHRNNCYQRNLSGEYGSPGIDWHSCRAEEEEIVLSDSVGVPAGVNDSPQLVTFNFSGPAGIPISGTDMYLQVVYRGRLGREQNAVIVATNDISEPTYGEYFEYPYENWTYCQPYPSVNNNCSTRMDYVSWCSAGGLSKEACDDALGNRFKNKFSSGAQPIAGYDPSGNPVVPPETMADIANEPSLPNPLTVSVTPVGTLTRIAVLTDAVPNNFLTTVQENIPGTKFQWWTTNFYRVRNQKDQTTGALILDEEFVLYRGQYIRKSALQKFMAYDPYPDPNDSGQLTLKTSQINF